MILKTTFNYFFKFFYRSGIYRKRNNKELFFLTIDTDDFKIITVEDYFAPAADRRSGIQSASLLQLQEGEVPVNPFSFTSTCNSNNLIARIPSNYGDFFD